MKRTLAVILAAAMACAFVTSAEAARAKRKKRVKVKIKEVDLKGIMHGPDIWAQAEAKLAHDKQGNIIYCEHEPIDEDNSRHAAVHQTLEAPAWTEGGPEGTVYPIATEDVVDSFLEAFEAALPILDIGDIDEPGGAREGDLTAEGLEDLKGISEVLLLRSRDLVKVYAILAREQRVKGEGRLKIDPELRRGKVEDAILRATEDWLEAVERLERSAMRLRRGALVRSPAQLLGAWKALVAAGIELPQLRSSMQALLVKRERRRSKKE